MNSQIFQQLSEADQVAFLLKQTFENTDSKQRKEAEGLLVSLKKNPKKFTELMVSVIIAPDSECILPF